MAHGFAVYGGPVATFIASLTAAGVAGTFGWFQYRLARTQRDIAFEKLKFDLFDRRYALFKKVFDILDKLGAPPDPLVETNWSALVDEVPVNEIRFLYPEATVEFATEVQDLCGRASNCAYMKEVNGASDAEVDAEKRAIYAEAFRLDEMVYKVFMPELGLGNLRDHIRA